MSVSDFRSDTLTQPTAAMREAMAAAQVGDDVLDGDPTVRRLEERAAAWLGKERALLVPSGTMANQVALGCWTRPGDEVIVQRWAHVTTFEAGAPGALHGVQTITLGGLEGRMDPDEVRAAIRPDYVHCPRTSLVCLEQTHNVACGRVLTMQEVRGVAEVARAAGVRVHLDGARLANAVVASGIPAHEWAAEADSVSICLSKGLGAPVGSLVAGDEQFQRRAVVMRKRLGGWMRQAGHLAAAGLIALEQGLERLAQDHALARDLALRLASIEGLECDPASVETNIVTVTVSHPHLDVPTLLAGLAERGVRAMEITPGVARFLTHRDVGPADATRAEAAAREVLLG